MKGNRLLDDSADELIGTAITIYISQGKPMGKIMYFAGMNPHQRTCSCFGKFKGGVYLLPRGSIKQHWDHPRPKCAVEIIPEQAFMD
jgi:hypothetical protein